MYSLALLVNVCGFLLVGGDRDALPLDPGRAADADARLHPAVPRPGRTCRSTCSSGAMHSIARAQPDHLRAGGGREASSPGEPECRSRSAFCLAAALAGALVLWALQGPAPGGSRRLAARKSRRRPVRYGGPGGSPRPGPAEPFPLGPTWDGQRNELLALQRERRAASSSACSTTRTARSGSRSANGRRTTGTSTCPASGRGSATATGSTGPGSPQRGHRFNPAQAADRPVREGGRGPRSATAGARARVRRRRRGRAPTATDSARSDPEAPSWIDASFDWEGDQLLRAALGFLTVIYELHVKGFTEQNARRAPGPARHLCGSRIGAAIAPPRELGVTAVELMPIHHFVHERRMSIADCGITGATTRWATLLLVAEYASQNLLGIDRIPGDPRDGEALHRGRPGGDKRRRIRPSTGRGKRDAVRRSASVASTTGPTIGWVPDNPASY